MALIAKLSHYLGPDLKVVKIPGPAAALREFLGCIVEAVTSRDPDDLNNVTQVKCRKACGGNIMAHFDQGNHLSIRWSCTSCKESGLLSGWENTLWDKRSM
jgi:hypothetical protein